MSMEENHSAHDQHKQHTTDNQSNDDIMPLVAQAARKLKPYHTIVEPSLASGRAYAFDRDTLVRLADETALLKELLRECKRHIEADRLDEYRALITARGAVDAYIRQWLPDAAITAKAGVDWSIAPPPSAELDVLIQVAVLLLLDLEQAI